MELKKLNISRISRVKVIDNSAETLNKANLKCEEARAFINNAQQHNYQENLLKAVDLYVEAISIYSRLVEPYLALADISWQFGKTKQATGLLNKVLEIEPGQENAEKMLKKLKNELLSREKASIISKVADKALSVRNEEKPKIQGLIGKTGLPIKKASGAINSAKTDSYTDLLQQARKISDEKKRR